MKGSTNLLRMSRWGVGVGGLPKSYATYQEKGVVHLRFHDGGGG